MSGNDEGKGKGTVTPGLGKEAQKTDITSSMALGPSWVVRFLSDTGDLGWGLTNKLSQSYLMEAFI